MIIKIAIIILLVVLLFGCNDGGQSVIIHPVDENVSTSLQGSDVYRHRYISQGMTYEVIYLRETIGTTGIVMPMEVINVTKDSLRVEQLRRTIK